MIEKLVSAFYHVAYLTYSNIFLRKSEFHIFSHHENYWETIVPTEIDSCSFSTNIAGLRRRAANSKSNVAPLLAVIQNAIVTRLIWINRMNYSDQFLVHFIGLSVHIFANRWKGCDFLSPCQLEVSVLLSAEIEGLIELVWILFMINVAFKWV